jgi:hypothetical protein
MDVFPSASSACMASNHQSLFSDLSTPTRRYNNYSEATIDTGSKQAWILGSRLLSRSHCHSPAGRLLAEHILRQFSRRSLYHHLVRQTEEPTTLTLQGPQGPCSPMAIQPTAIPSCHHPSKVSRAVDKAISDSTRLDLCLSLRHPRRLKKQPMLLRVR